MSNQLTAYLSNNGEYTTFTFRDRTITFLTSKNLERYTGVKVWDNGYIVATAKYLTCQTEKEEYIDLIPILNNLYMNAELFLKPIKQVEVRYL